MQDSHHASYQGNAPDGSGGPPTEQCSCDEDADELEPWRQMDGDGTIWIGGSVVTCVDGTVQL